ncbi:jg7291 [Pararge aegeria aegeria]|uniref:Jg7291 protein n=1 Tax=Pararge aegeria aegeria TaxID=348720 RepID=A0A8S4QQE0_9NEOP|nr:jg7291 [Pararge aegeria aegeria]
MEKPGRKYGRRSGIGRAFHTLAVRIRHLDEKHFVRVDWISFHGAASRSAVKRYRGNKFVKGSVPLVKDLLAGNG